MHLGRFHRAITMLAEDFKEIGHAVLIQNIITALNAVAANPANPEIAKSFKTQLDQCRVKLESSRLNRVRPILHSILSSINAPEFIGTRLSDRILREIAENHAAPALAVQGLSALYNQVAVFYENIVTIDNAFTKLQVEYDELDEGESEIGLLVPRNENASSLKELSKEFSDWHNALTQISQLFDITSGPLQIRTCSTTDWMIYLAATPPILKGLSICIQGVNTILRDLIATRSLIEQLVSKTGPSKHTDALLEENDSKLSKNIRDFAEKIVDEHAAQSLDQGTKNEMKNGITVALKTIALKLNNGAKIELRMIPHAVPEEASDEGASDDEQKTSQQELDRAEELISLSSTLDQEMDLMNLETGSNSFNLFLSPPTEENEQT